MTNLSDAKTTYMDRQIVENFQQLIWDFFAQNRRDFAWRYCNDPYYVLVSEVMLQQTQTFRVEPKFEQFITSFPSFACLANAQWADVLSAWQGLGYNSRAKRLQLTAQIIVRDFGSVVPTDTEQLVKMPGIGPYTAASICAFAYNKPTIFVETNIRAVFIHHFFSHADTVHDAEILPLVEQTLDTSDPRSWYYALMDYGVFLKKNVANPARRSKHYTRQSKFEGSDRQIRGMILRQLLVKKSISRQDLIASIDREPARTTRIIQQLCDEQLLVQNGTTISLT